MNLPYDKMEGTEVLEDEVIETKELLVQKAINQALIDKDIANKANFQVLEERAKEILVGLEYFFAEDVLETSVETHPLTWWDAFKNKWFPRFMKRRYPVRFGRVEFSVRARYPEAFDLLPKEQMGNHVVTISHRKLQPTYDAGE